MPTILPTLLSLVLAVPAAAGAPNPVALLFAEDASGDPAHGLEIFARYCADERFSCEGIHLGRAMGQGTDGQIWSLGDIVAIPYSERDQGGVFMMGTRRARFARFLLVLAVTPEGAMTEGQRNYKANFVKSLRLSPMSYRSVKCSELARNCPSEMKDWPIEIGRFTLSAEIISAKEPQRGPQLVEVEFGDAGR